MAQGLAGGLTSIAEGGNFTSGFLAGGVGSLGPTPAAGESWEQAIGGVVEHAVLGGAASVLGGGKFANGAITGAFAYAAETCASGGCEMHEELARSNGPQNGSEIPADQREQIIDKAISTFRSQGGWGIVINDYDIYEISDASGTQFDHYDTLAEMNAGIAQHEEDSGEDWGPVSGWSNGFLSKIYASAAYPQSDVYGLSINPATSTLFIIWHENGHQGWPMGGNCILFNPEACANTWAQNHINKKPGQ